ncbi:MAG: 2-C-methyl-D-erythritol 4-phosphate cytidylyltransferase [Clostridiales bacterium]|nr:2-C-methyl-D-erythritol 4-phosphate cytidylyltransferase [Clostridiales bacterium]
MAGLFSKLFHRGQDDHPYCAAVVPAAGSASRMQGIDKVLADLGGMPVLARTLLALQNCPLIDEIVVVTREDLIVPISNLCAQYAIDKMTKVVRGGRDRAESVSLGLREISRQAELAAIHDGARPFVSQEILREVLETAAKTGAAAPAVPVKDTIKQAADGKIQRTVDRSTLFAVQTPQVFQADFIAGALQRCRKQGIPLTDDCSAAEALGMTVTLTTGSYENLKITTPIDLAMGEAILQCQAQV